VRGGLVAEPISEALLSLEAGSEVLLGENHSPMVFQELRRHGRRWLLWLDGIESREQAETLRGAEIALPLSAVSPLPEGTYYWWQILGMRVVSDEGQELGQVDEILETGANDVYAVRDLTGAELLIPAIESVILDVDLQAGEITVHLLPGL
jgi:16S rRNA processing protein RimM